MARFRMWAAGAVAVAGLAGPVVLAPPAAAEQVLTFIDRTAHPLTAPNAGAPTTIEVPDGVAPIVGIEVGIPAIRHTESGDVDILLVGPTGAAVVLFADVGGGTDIDLAVIFQDGAPPVPSGGTTTNGIYRPTNGAGPDLFPAPAPAPNATALSAFVGTDPGGTWSLYAVDDDGVVTGSLAEGWALRLTVETNPCAGITDDGFTDVDADNVHESSIDCLVGRDVASGTSATTFDPSGEVSRGQMASFVARTLEATTEDPPANPPDAFADDTGSIHERRINQLAAADVIGGNGEQGVNYRPTADMRRDHMASFMANAYEFVVGEDLPAGPDAFVDDAGNAFEDEINGLAALGVITGTGQLRFDPDGTVSRAQMASFLVRLLGLFDAFSLLDP